MRAALSFLGLASCAVALSSEVGSSSSQEVLAEDDECSQDTAAREACAVSALQRRGVAASALADVEATAIAAETGVAARARRHFQRGGSKRRAFCKESCWAKFGFDEGDCKCSVHGSWYMWICWRHKGSRIKTQYGKQYTCSGLKPVGAPSSPSPAPPSCAAAWSHNCQASKSCCDKTMTCFEKNAGGWAACMPSCTKGINYHEAPRYRTPWSCNVLGGYLATTTTTTLIPSPYNSKYLPHDPALARPSNASLMTFHLFRVRSDENYSCCENANLATAGAAMFYLHNEIVWHPTSRSGTNFDTAKTRIQRYKVTTKATQPLLDLGMDFGVMNEFDLTQCTGPFECDNFRRFGYAVGCEDWQEGSPANFPHQQWNLLNSYPNASWFSLPGACPMSALAHKSDECKLTHPGGECPKGITPSGTGDCTYTMEDAGEIRLDDMVGISSYEEFVSKGGREYDPITDQGVHLNFWDGKLDDVLCKQRTEHMISMFDSKYPDEKTMQAPTCNFNKFRFYAGTPHKA